jgi:hypothetical protein
MNEIKDAYVGTVVGICHDSHTLTKFGATVRLVGLWIAYIVQEVQPTFEHDGRFVYMTQYTIVAYAA